MPLLQRILASKEFAEASYHTGSVPQWVDEMRQRNLAHLSGESLQHHLQYRSVPEPVPAGANGKTDRETAAAIGLALAMAMDKPKASASGWKAHRRREQLNPRGTGSRGWR